MASDSGSTGFLPDITIDRYADLYMPCFDPDLFVLEDASLLQNSFEPPQPSLLPPSPTGEFLASISSEMLPYVSSVQRTEHNSLPSLPTFPRATTAFLPANVVGNHDPRYEGTVRADSRITGGEHSYIAVPTIPLPTPPLLSAATFPPNRIKIPQKSYDHGRKQWNFKPLEPIRFSTNGRPGINLRDALHKEFAGLDGRDDPMLQGVGGAISCRLLFPGYPDNGRSCQIHTLNWAKDRLSIRRSKLAHEVAKKLERYLNHMARVAPDESVEDRWRIGRGFMRIDNMFLVSLVSVSKGSFQPEIWVADPSIPSV